VNIMRLGEQYMAMTESPMPVVFDPETLESLGVQAPRPGRFQPRILTVIRRQAS